MSIFSTRCIPSVVQIQSAYGKSDKVIEYFEKILTIEINRNGHLLNT